MCHFWALFVDTVVAGDSVNVIKKRKKKTRLVQIDWM